MAFNPNRRDFIRAALVTGGVTMALPLEALLARASHADSFDSLISAGYGPLAPVKDENTGLPLLDLPEGFRYRTFGWIGDRMDGAGGLRTPGYHDGMAAFAGTGSRVVLVRNHEGLRGPAFNPACSYDPEAGGGTSILEFDAASGRFVSQRAALAGTTRNCAGGPTPWGSWLTCEESLVEPGPDLPYTRKHGYIFEVPVSGTPTCEPLVPMGRFVHEAAAVDPATSIVYETEDARTAGLYRFVPNRPGELAGGGRLEMLAIAGRPGFDTRVGQRAGVQYPVNWVPIEEPDRAHEDATRKDGRGVFSQGRAQGAAVFARLEGASYDDGRVFLTATTGGAAKMGQVWELDVAEQRLRLVFESPGAEVLNMPDNACRSPRGGLVICEDGTMNPCVQGLTADGRIFRFARNNVVLHGERNGIRGDFRESEVAGAAYSPDGQWLFFNVQRPGFTVAVTGPWADGLL